MIKQIPLLELYREETEDILHRATRRFGVWKSAAKENCIECSRDSVCVCVCSARAAVDVFYACVCIWAAV